MEPSRNSIYFTCYAGFDPEKIWLLDCASARVAPIDEDVFRTEWSGVAFFPSHKIINMVLLLKYFSIFLFVAVVICRFRDFMLEAIWR